MNSKINEGDKGRSVLLAFDVFGSDSVKNPSTFVGDDSRVELESISLLVFLDNFLLLQLLQSPSDDLEGGVFVLGSSSGHSLLATEKMGEESDSGSGPDVDFSGKGGDSVVYPVIIKGRKFLS